MVQNGRLRWVKRWRNRFKSKKSRERATKCGPKWSFEMGQALQGKMHPRADDESLNLKIIGPPPASIGEKGAASWSAREINKGMQVTAASTQKAKGRFHFGPSEPTSKKMMASDGLAKRQRAESTACGSATTSATEAAAATKEQRNTMPRHPII